MKRYAIFAHYDVSGFVHDYVFFYLNELKQVSDAIIFVSDGTIKPQDKEKLSKYVNIISDEKHGEYDWGSYKKGYLAIKDKLTDKDELIFCNDSVFGPLTPFKQIFDKMKMQKADVWGINTASEKFLMSFFLVIRSTVFLTDYFHNFMKNIKKEATKKDVVEKYEKGFSELIYRNGHKISSYFTPSDIINHKFDDIPFFSFFCHFVKKDNFEVYDDNVIYLIKNGFPFIKKLSFKNKKNYLWALYPYITDNYDTKYIESYFSLKKQNSHLILLFKMMGLTFFKVLPTKNFFFSHKITKSGKKIIKICKIPIFIRKVK